MLAITVHVIAASFSWMISVAFPITPPHHCWYRGVKTRSKKLQSCVSPPPPKKSYLFKCCYISLYIIMNLLHWYNFKIVVKTDMNVYLWPPALAKVAQRDRLQKRSGTQPAEMVDSDSRWLRSTLSSSAILEVLHSGHKIAIIWLAATWLLWLYLAINCVCKIQLCCTNVSSHAALLTA